MPKLHVKEIRTGAIVLSVNISHPTPRHVEWVMRGILINMDTDRFYIDDSECKEKEDE